MNDFDLSRFLTAQNTGSHGSTYERALAEIRGGQKYSHWIWYIFPQIRGLGRSANASFFALGSMEEANAYMRHEILGARLAEISEALLALRETNILYVLGGIDSVKVRSCMTLFSKTENAPDVFERVLAKYFGGKEDKKTLALLGL